MIPPPIPENEAERLENLRSFSLLDTPFEQVYDEIVSLASVICEMPYAAVSLIDANRQWFKAACGLGNVRETPREHSFCGYTILGHDLMYVYDARQDERFFDNPLVTGSLHIRSYVGVPLASSEGFNLGTLCVFSDRPKDMSPVQRDSLRKLGTLVTNLFEARKREAWLAKIGQVLNNLQEEVMLVGPQTGRCIYANRAASAAFERMGRMVLGSKVADLVDGGPRPELEESLTRLLSGSLSQFVLEQERTGRDEGGQPFSYPVEVCIRPLPYARDPVFVWVGIDISERKRLERMAGQS